MRALNLFWANTAKLRFNIGFDVCIFCFYLALRFPETVEHNAFCFSVYADNEKRDGPSKFYLAFQKSLSLGR